MLQASMLRRHVRRAPRVLSEQVDFVSLAAGTCRRGSAYGNWVGMVYFNQFGYGFAGLGIDYSTNQRIANFHTSIATFFFSKQARFWHDARVARRRPP